MSNPHPPYQKGMGAVFFVTLCAMRFALCGFIRDSP
jgi:hypothetical protein